MKNEKRSPRSRSSLKSDDDQVFDRIFDDWNTANGQNEQIETDDNGSTGSELMTVSRNWEEDAQVQPLRALLLTVSR
jgi:hypothetical protein